jgi:hypothetical protein
MGIILIVPKNNSGDYSHDRVESIYSMNNTSPLNTKPINITEISNSKELLTQQVINNCMIFRVVDKETTISSCIIAAILVNCGFFARQGINN